MRGREYGTPFSETATGSTSATATHAASTDKRYFVTDVAVSSDKAGAICLIKSGTTVIWQVQVGDIGSDTSHYEQSFGIGLGGVKGELVSVEVDGTSACKANLIGYEL